jgi:hypothetical protein
MQMFAAAVINIRRLRFHLRSHALSLVGVLILFGCAHQGAPAGHLSHLRGQLLDSGGRPVSQYAMRLEPTSASLPSFSSVTDYSGYFEFADVPKGTYIAYPANRPSATGKTIHVEGRPTEFIGKVDFGSSIAVDLNAAAAPVINDQARQTINPEAARTINADAAKTINPDAARMINPAAARTINPEAARTINPDAARVLNPERAKILTSEQAQRLTVQQAQEPIRPK